MSHTVTMETRLYDPVALGAACRRLKLPEPTQGTARLYSGEATGLLVQLPDWQYPVVIDTTSGQIAYDNFQGHWGAQEHLDAFLQAYLVERTKREGRAQGYPVHETTLADGSIMVEVVEGQA